MADSPEQSKSTAAPSTSQNERTSGIKNATIKGSIGNFVLVLFKLAAAKMANSPAMLADAIHSLSDFITDIIVLIFVNISGKPQDKSHEYGHGKYETLGSAIIGLALTAASIMLMVGSGSSLLDFFHGKVMPKPGIVALIAAIVSILVKEWLYQYTIRKARKLNSPAMVANAWHHRSDAISSIAAALGIGGAIVFGGKWTVLDPLACMIISFMLLKVSFDLLKGNIGELLDHALPEEIEQKILGVVTSFNEVCEPHNLRTRSIGTRSSIDLHIRMDGNLTVHRAHDVTLAIEHELKALLGDDTIINLHVEPIKN